MGCSNDKNIKTKDEQYIPQKILKDHTNPIL